MYAGCRPGAGPDLGGDRCARRPARHLASRLCSLAPHRDRPPPQPDELTYLALASCRRPLRAPHAGIRSDRPRRSRHGSTRSAGSSRVEAPPVGLDTDPRPLLFTDIVGSTDRADELGDLRLEGSGRRHHAWCAVSWSAGRGVERDTAGDGFFADLRRPRAGDPLRPRDPRRTSAARPRGPGRRSIPARASSSVASSAVWRSLRRLVHATPPVPAEGLVSQTVKLLRRWLGTRVRRRWLEHELKGVPGEWRLYAVD